MNKVERRIGLGVGVAILAFVMFLIAKNEPFAAPELFELTRIIISLGIGIVAATIPGWLGVKGDIQGVSIRAGGGLAAFVITYFFSPGTMPALTPPPPGVVDVDPITIVDFRTIAPPTAADPDRENAALAVTIPVVLRSKIQPSLGNTIERTRVRMSVGDDSYDLAWRDFVQMHEENFGKWLGKVSDAIPFSIASGEIAYREILHTDDGSISWGNFLSTVRNSGQDSIDVEINIETDRDIITATCAADMRERNIEIEEFISLVDRIPGRITTPCILMGG